MKNNIIIYTLLSLIIIPYYSFGVESNDIRQFIRVFLYMDRNTFNEDEPVNLNICIKNISKNKVLLKVYDIDYTSFQPVVYDKKAKEAEIIVPYLLMKKKSKDIIKKYHPRIIELSSNEIIHHPINLKKIYNLKHMMEYRVKGYFFTDSNFSQAKPSENKLTFRINKSSGAIKKDGLEHIIHNISPSEVILLVLTAEKNKNWINFIKYIKLPNYINAFSNFVRKYTIANKSSKNIILNNFRQFLTRERKDFIIDFKILKELLLNNRNIAFVETIVKRFGGKKPFTYKYKYTLEKYRDFWLITDIEATVL